MARGKRGGQSSGSTISASCRSKRIIEKAELAAKEAPTDASERAAMAPSRKTAKPIGARENPNGSESNQDEGTAKQYRVVSVSSRSEKVGDSREGAEKENDRRNDDGDSKQKGKQGGRDSAQTRTVGTSAVDSSALKASRSNSANSTASAKAAETTKMRVAETRNTHQKNGGDSKQLGKQVGQDNTQAQSDAIMAVTRSAAKAARSKSANSPAPANAVEKRKDRRNDDGSNKQKGKQVGRGNSQARSVGTRTITRSSAIATRSNIADSPTSTKAAKKKAKPPAEVTEKTRDPLSNDMPMKATKTTKTLAPTKATKKTRDALSNDAPTKATKTTKTPSPTKGTEKTRDALSNDALTKATKTTKTPLPTKGTEKMRDALSNDVPTKATKKTKTPAPTPTKRDTLSNDMLMNAAMTAKTPAPAKGTKKTRDVLSNDTMSQKSSRVKSESLARSENADYGRNDEVSDDEFIFFIDNLYAQSNVYTTKTKDFLKALEQHYGFELSEEAKSFTRNRIKELNDGKVQPLVRKGDVLERSLDEISFGESINETEDPPDSTPTNNRHVLFEDNESFLTFRVHAESSPESMASSQKVIDELVTEESLEPEDLDEPVVNSLASLLSNLHVGVEVYSVDKVDLETAQAGSEIVDLRSGRTMVDIEFPPGRLGVSIVKADETWTKVFSVDPKCALAGRVQEGDLIDFIGNFRACKKTVQEIAGHLQRTSLRTRIVRVWRQEISHNEGTSQTTTNNQGSYASSRGGRGRGHGQRGITGRGGRGTARGQGPAIPSKWTKSGRKVVEDDVRKENEREEAQKLRNKRKQFVDTGATKIADIRGTGAEEQKERMYHHLFVHDKMVTPVPVIDGASTSNWPKNISVHFNVDHFKDSNKNGGRRPKGLVNNLREKPLVTIAVRDQTSFDDFRVVLQSLLGSSWTSNDDFDVVIANDKESAMLGNGASRRREIAAHVPTRHVSAMDTPGIESPVRRAHQSPRSRQASRMREDSGTPAKSTARIPFSAKTPGPGRKTHADTRPNMK